MAKAKATNIPKYLKLAKGTMWFDTDGKNASGVRLIAANEVLVGRGYNTDNEWEHYKKQGYLVERPIPRDQYSNLNSEDGKYGSIKLEEDKSYFCTTDIPNEKLINILTAYQNGILVKFDPNKRVKAKEEDDEMTADQKTFPVQQKDFGYKHDGDMIFQGKNKEIFNKLQTLTFEKLNKFISDSRSRVNLQDMLDYELKGYNPLSRPREEVIKLIRNQLNKFGGGITPIRVDEDE